MDVRHDSEAAGVCFVCMLVCVRGVICVVVYVRSMSYMLMCVRGMVCMSVNVRHEYWCVSDVMHLVFVRRMVYMRCVARGWFVCMLVHMCSEMARYVC